MTIWDSYCKVLAQTKIVYHGPSGDIVMPEIIKPEVLSVAMEECSYGTAPLVIGCHDHRGEFDAPLNFHSMQNKTGVLVDFPMGKVSYKGPDGWRDYFSFRSLIDEITAFWAFLHRYHYPDIDKHLTSGADFVNYFLPIYCEYGFGASFKLAHGGRNYAQVVLEVHRPKAVAALKSYGWKEETMPIPTPVPPPVPPSIPISSEYYIRNGKLFGPDVHYRWVKNFDPWKRFATDGICVHSTDCLAGTSNVLCADGCGLKSPGILDAWDNAQLPYNQRHSAPLLFLRNGIIWQSVNLDYIAYHTYGHNGHLLGFEYEHYRLCNWWEEIFGYFFTYKGKLWEQKIAKKDLVPLANGQYAQYYTQEQIDKTNLVLPIIRTYYNGAIKTIRGHNYYCATDCPSIFPFQDIEG